MTTQTNAGGDTYQPAVRIGQGDYERVWPDPHATIDLDKRSGTSDDPFALLVGMGYMLVVMLAALTLLTKCGILTWHWST